MKPRFFILIPIIFLFSCGKKTPDELIAGKWRMDKDATVHRSPEYKNDHTYSFIDVPTGKETPKGSWKFMNGGKQLVCVDSAGKESSENIITLNADSLVTESSGLVFVSYREK